MTNKNEIFDWGVFTVMLTSASVIVDIGFDLARVSPLFSSLETALFAIALGLFGESLYACIKSREINKSSSLYRLAGISFIFVIFSSAAFGFTLCYSGSGIEEQFYGEHIATMAAIFDALALICGFLTHLTIKRGKNVNVRAENH